ncbi:hypothetical protein ACTWJ8_24480 [Streptomyces sp. SDT5-1]|uniref:hypothetical protein n=1 Tax=Streptomyces sp. SDT5-1 TaxID=3406418 RepID=UPI003FD29304
MNLRRTTTTRRALAAATIAAGLALSVTACGGDGEKSDGEATKSSAPAQRGSDSKEQSSEPATNEPLAEVKGEGGITLTVTSAQRDAGGFVTVKGTVANGTGKAWVPVDWRGDERELMSNGGSIAGASLVDQKDKKKYLILRDTEGRCLCTRFTGGVRNGQTADWYAQFPAPPEGTSEVAFQVGSMPPAQLDITEGN